MWILAEKQNTCDLRPPLAYANRAIGSVSHVELWVQDDHVPHTVIGTVALVAGTALAGIVVLTDPAVPVAFVLIEPIVTVFAAAAGVFG